MVTTARVPTPDFHETSVEFCGTRWALAVPANDHIGSIVERTHVPYEADLLHFTCSLLQPNDLVVDVGANIGNHSLCWAMSAHSRVISIEPNPVALVYLRRNVELNAMAEHIHIEPVAVGAATGRAEIANVVPGNLGATSIAQSPLGEIILRRLDDVLGPATPHVKLLKIDVEGAEPQVLAGAVRTIEQSHPLIVAEAGTLAEARAIDEILFEYGYHREPHNLAATPTYLWRPSGQSNAPAPRQA